MNSKRFTLVRTAGSWAMALGMVAAMLFTAVNPAYAAATTTITSITLSAQGGALTYGTAGSATYTVTVTANGRLQNVGFNVPSLPAGASASFNPATLSFSSTLLTKTTTLTITTTAAAPAGAVPFNVAFTVSGKKGGTTVGNGTLTVGPRMLDVQGTLVQDKVYDGNVNATLNPACTAVITTNCASLLNVLGADQVLLNTGTGHGVFVSKEVGTEDVAVTGMTIGGTGASNYALPATVMSSANISKAPLSVTSNDAFMVAGGTVPAFNFTYSGFAASEDGSVIDVAPVCDVPAKDYSLGSHAIVCSGASDNDYDFTYDNAGILTVHSVNQPPTDIALSNQTIGQSAPLGATVGNLTTTDADSVFGETYSYSLPSSVVGHVCTDNASFQVNSSLITNGAVPLQTSAVLQIGTYNICVQTDDHNPNGVFVKDFAITVVSNTVTFTSNAANDGWVLEAGEFTNLGGSKNAGAATLRVGDDALNQQYKSILSFDTSSLPDNAVITQVTINVLKQRIVGGNKIFASLKGLVADVNDPSFGKLGLQANDFQAKTPVATGMKAAALFSSTPDVNGWYSANLNPVAFKYVNLGGTTQFRLHFVKDDNNNLLANILQLFSGNAANPAQRPQLVITYSVP